MSIYSSKLGGNSYSHKALHDKQIRIHVCTYQYMNEYFLEQAQEILLHVLTNLLIVDSITENNGKYNHK